MKNSILSLPKRKAEFIEPMECAPVTKLLDAPGWFYGVYGYVALGMQCCVGSHKNRLATPHNS